MRVALILTGEIRTLNKTHQVILEKIIAPLQADIFIHAGKTDYRQSTDVDENIFLSYWGDYVKDYAFMTPENEAEYAKIKEIILTHKPGCKEEVVSRSGVNRSYITDSGTMIEYYQIWQASKMMLQYEKKHQFKYDYVIRSRLDIILTYTPDLNLLPLRTIFTYRTNMVWIMRREDALIALPLIYFFGDYDDGSAFTWNSESQFQQHLKHFGICHTDFWNEIESAVLTAKALNLSVIMPDGRLNPDLSPELRMTVIRSENYANFYR